MFSFTPATRQASICRTSSRAGLQQLLEDHPVGDVLAGGDLDRRDGVADPARPRISSGLVGSSTQYGSHGASAVIAVDRLR